VFYAVFLFRHEIFFLGLQKAYNEKDISRFIPTSFCLLKNIYSDMRFFGICVSGIVIFALHTNQKFKL